MNLTRLALSAEDRWTMKSAPVLSANWTIADGVHLEDSEKDRVREMMEECGFTQARAMRNFDARLYTGLPPTGYAATWRSDSPFVADAFDHNAFRGVAIVSLQRTRNPLKGFQTGLADLNALLGDASPVPFTRQTAQKGNWVCSLGPFSWVGIYQQHMPKPPYAAVVVAGLDAASWEACRKEMREEWHRVKTVEEIYDRIEFWRDAARKNRSRILATFLRVMNEHPHDGGSMVHTAYAYVSRGLDKKSDEALSWFQQTHVRVPEWFVFPSRSPKDCAPLPCEPGTGVICPESRRETSPFEIHPDVDVVMDDLIRYGESEFVRLAGCCDARKRVVVCGPQDEILIMESTSKNQSCPETLNAYACQAMQRVNLYAREEEEDTGVTRTWEDGNLTSNRLLNSAFVFHAAMDTHDAQRLMPICVRVSCRDSEGRAVAVDDKTHRFASLAMDDWTPITR